MKFPPRILPLTATGLLLGTCVLTLAHPDIAHAETVNVALTNRPQILEYWKFFRGFINYGLVIALILAAFSSVTRFNIDTYSLKKILPALITGFVLSNFSFFICQIILNLAESLFHTVDVLAPSGTAVYESFFNNFHSAVTTVTSHLSTTIIAANSVGTIVIFLFLAILILLIPVAVTWILVILFYIRFWVVLALVTVSPLAFMALGFPATQGYFKKWWGFLLTWTFMKPIAYAILGASVFLITGSNFFADESGQKGFLGNTVGLILGIAGMGAAIYIPFKMGGAVNAVLNSIGKTLGKGIGNQTRFGLAGLGNRMAGSRNRAVSAFGRGLSGTLFLPEAIKDAREYRRQEIGAAGRSHGARLIGNTQAAERFENAQIGELQKQYEGMDSDELAQALVSSHNIQERAAIFRYAYSKGEQHRLFNAINKLIRANGNVSKQFGLTRGQQIVGEKREQLRTIARTYALGGRIGAGNVITGSATAIRENAILQKMAKGNGFANEAATVQRDVRTGQLKAQNQTYINNSVGAYLSNNPREIATKAKHDVWIREDTTGVSHLSEGVKAAIKNGELDSVVSNNHMQFLSTPVRNALQSNPKIVKEIRDVFGTTKIALANQFINDAKL